MSRAPCPCCGSSSAMGDVHCFKCGYINPYGNIDKSGMFGNGRTPSVTRVLELRDDLTLNPDRFSTKALKWLFQAGIYSNVIRKQLIGYCETINKVLVPAFNTEDELMFYQLRALSGVDGVKYITYGSMRNYTIHYHDFKDDDTIVICEDHLSGIRLRQFNNVVCLSGTSLNYSFIKEFILPNFSKVIFWLDPDRPGQAATFKNAQRIQYLANKQNTKNLFVNTNFKNISIWKVDHRLNPLDPKYCFNYQIVEAMQNNLVKV